MLNFVTISCCALDSDLQDPFFLDLPDPCPFLFEQIWILLFSFVTKPWLLPTVMRLLYDFLSLKNDVNVPSKSDTQKNFCASVLKVNDQDPDPDPLVRGTDPQIRILAKCHESAILIGSGTLVSWASSYHTHLLSCLLLFLFLVAHLEILVSLSKKTNWTRG
jgi:hypothetical protein